MKVVSEPAMRAREGGVIVLERLGGRREVERVNTYYVYDEWAATAHIRNAKDDRALDAFLESAWTALRDMVAYNTWDSQYLPNDEGQANIRRAMVSFTTIRTESIS